MEKQEYVARYRESDKKAQPLKDHLEQTAKLAAALVGPIRVERLAYLCGLLHDLGKATDAFFAYIRSACGILSIGDPEYVDAQKLKGKIDHATAGAQYIYELLMSYGERGRLPGELAALIIASHHSGMINGLSTSGENDLYNRLSKEDINARRMEALGNVDSDILHCAKCITDSGVIDRELADFLMRMYGISKKSKIVTFGLGMLVRYIFSCVIDADRLSSIAFEKNRELHEPKKTDFQALLLCLEDKIRNLPLRHSIDPLRCEISNRCRDFAQKSPGVYQFTAPTGSGKTVSSLRFAVGHAAKNELRRIFYIIPYTSIIEQNAQRIRELLEDADNRGTIVLEHHSNLLPEVETEDNERLIENWDAPIVLTTMVQFLECLFGKGTRSARRMHALAESVIIFDEIQALPVKCIYLFNEAIRFSTQICGSTVLLCTATQPGLDRLSDTDRSLKIHAENKILPDAQKFFDAFSRVRVHNRIRAEGWNSENIANLADESSKKAGSVLIVTNTKAVAREIFHQLNGSDDLSTYHLSTSMCPEHRRNVLALIEDSLDKKDRRTICVSTQLIEAGVDISFGCVIRCAAGMDSIAQAAGRCNRHAENPDKGDVFVINFRNENLKHLPDILKGRQATLDLFCEFVRNPSKFDNDLMGVKMIERYFSYYFEKQKNQMAYPTPEGQDMFAMLSTNGNAVNAYAQDLNKVAPLPHFKQSFADASHSFHAIDTNAQGVIVPYGEGKKIIADLCGKTGTYEKQALLKAAQRYTVNLFTYEWESLCRSEGIHIIEKTGVFYLDEDYYNSSHGVVLEPESRTSFINE